MRMPKSHPAPITRIVNIHQTRLREITTLLADEYPTLVSTGIDSFAAVHDRLATTACLEAYLDSSPVTVVERIIRKAKAEFGQGRWVTEADVKKYLMKWMGDTLRSQVFNSQEEHWRVYLRQKLQYIVSATESSASSRSPQGLWSKQRMAWKVHLASRSRDSREPPYPQPFIRHLRVQHNSLARLPARYLRGRSAKWARKKHVMAKRAVEGFSSPLRMEILPDADIEVEDGEECEVSREVGGPGPAGSEDRNHIAMSTYLIPPELATADIPSHVSITIGSKQTDPEAAAPRAPMIRRETTSCNSIYWNWGQRWLGEGAGHGGDIGREMLAMGRLGECA